VAAGCPISAWSLRSSLNSSSSPPDFSTSLQQLELARRDEGQRDVGGHGALARFKGHSREVRKGSGELAEEGTERDRVAGELGGEEVAGEWRDDESA
jgi:hypothetical protein